ncbi:MAG TPA: P-type DNA transfer ATPase VirB11 [Caulobacteraceae bacterium]|jgi:type IV secretion system protein VirB11|nr:P-type DNA transfer ATPase VirB11 [Caulobacteraceae bacterium]
MSAGVYLAAYLAPFEAWLARADVTDLLVNQPGEVWIETVGGGLTRQDAPQVTEVVLTRLARQIAAASHQGVNREQPLLSAALPDGARVQIVAPPATRGGLALAVRKHAIADLSLDHLADGGLFAPGAWTTGRLDDADLSARLEAGDTHGFLRAAVKARKTMVIAGGTSSGKTTLLNALIKEIDPAERLLVIEDAPEVKLPHVNAVGLLATRGDQGEARVDADDLLAAALRMRPDRILLGELRGKEAFAFLRAVNTGHPGSITTVHADTPEGAIDQIALLALMSGVDLGWPMVRAYVRQVVEVIVQMRRVDGQRRVSEVLFRSGGLGERPNGGAEASG